MAVTSMLYFELNLFLNNTMLVNVMHEAPFQYDK